MHFLASSVIVITIALVCQLSEAAAPPNDKLTKVVFSCTPPAKATDPKHLLAACGKAIENSNPKKFSFVAANKVQNSDFDYNCIETDMKNNYCCLAETFKFDGKAVDAEPKLVSSNCIVVPGK
ncbi:hypothetical protein PtA15_15A83 [Puccinia triticina]|uniref:Hydrophobin n=1 Tax=Puccinia triticina TaxID=208348 RepID=A0ABY7D9U9_9BASI|nr:uncharacterized protein PtA15_15A83 [Puccinia triticina]WAQ91692.1 hypothetical protein PtA15_15A83 [Puccinia triticina]